MQFSTPAETPELTGLKQVLVSKYYIAGIYHFAAFKNCFGAGIYWDVLGIYQNVELLVARLSTVFAYFCFNEYNVPGWPNG